MGPQDPRKALEGLATTATSFTNQHNDRNSTLRHTAERSREWDDAWNHTAELGCEQQLLPANDYPDGYIENMDRLNFPIQQDG